MNEQNKQYKPFKKSHKFFKKPSPKLPQAESVYMGAGYKAFRMKIYPDGNPYREAKQRSLWLRGYRQAERDFAQQIALSKAIEATLPLEESE